MKKIFSIFLAVIYLSTSSGLALQVHYCMDKISGFTFANNEEGSCGKCGMEKASNACCKDELKFLKLDDAHKLLVTDYQLNPVVAILPNTLLAYPSVSYTDASIPAYAAHAPPGKTGRSLNVLHCVFRV